MFQGFLAGKDDEIARDTSLVSLALTNYVGTAPNPVSPLARVLFQNGLVDIWDCGDYDELIADGQRPLDQRIEPCLDVVSLYDDVVENWGKRIADPSTYRSEDDLDYLSECGAPRPYVAEPKIGRNDPCPCGSGKKYKKCCLK